VYRILDEPQPSTWNHLVVQPLWPLFGLMFGGAWLSFPWFAVNGFALGSQDKYKTLGLALTGFGGALLLSSAILYLNSAGVLPQAGIPYAYLAVVVWKLGIGYFMYFGQSRTFEIYQHFGGPSKNGILLVMAAAFLARTKVLNLFDHFLWLAVMG